jgi:hypothetical protein
MIVDWLQPNSGNIYLDLNITDYPCTKEHSKELDILQEASVLEN